MFFLAYFFFILRIGMKEMLEINSFFYDFIVVTLLSLIIGLEQRRSHMEEEEGSNLLFGTDRTFTFIGIFGYILYVPEPGSKILFIAGGGVISVLLATTSNNIIKMFYLMYFA